MMLDQLAGLKTYVAECSWLLYQIYFQPYTLRRRLQAIHPDLNSTTNPFGLRAEFANNPQLARYAEQSWWLTAVTPVVAILIVAPLYSLLAETPFNLLRSSLVLLGWWAGIWLAKGDSGRWSDRLTTLLYIVIAAGGILLLILVFSPALDLVFSLVRLFVPFAGLLPSLGTLWLGTFGVATGVVG
jgi:hypothetical protein